MASTVPPTTTVLTPSAGVPAQLPETAPPLVRDLAQVRRTEIALVGGKGANLGEMLGSGLPVPPGFVVTVESYRRFVDANGLAAEFAAILAPLDRNDPDALNAAAERLRALVVAARMPDDVRGAITEAYRHVATANGGPPAVAVRSSATAEDTAEYSFAGMFESFLGVRGVDDLLDRVKRCWASAFGARVVFYRLDRGLPADMPVAVVVQRMIDATKSGVIFTADPATRDPWRIVIEAAWGLGEVVVQGQVTPDRYVLDKATRVLVEKEIETKEFLLTTDAQSGALVRVDLAADVRADARVLSDAELRSLGELAVRTEAHYGVPQDIEFAIENGTVYLTQTRPITTLREATAPAPRTPAARAPAARAPTPIVRGLGASPGIATGRVRVLASAAEEGAMEAGEVLVTRMTSPDWIPVMRRAVAIVTDSGGMTSHAAIVSRELGVPCIVGAHDATKRLATGAFVTVDGTSGTVVPAEGAQAAVAPAPVRAAAPRAPAAPAARPITATRLYVNLAEPERAEEVAARDVDGVGLLRAEFIMLDALERTHPRAFIDSGRGEEFVQRMADRLGVFGKAFHPRPVIYRAMDFRSNEFRGLLGGDEHAATSSAGSSAATSTSRARRIR